MSAVPRPACPHAPADRRGLTLPSLLVGLVLSTLVGALLGGATVGVLRAAHRQHTRLRLREQLTHAAQVIGWELRDVAPRPTATDVGDLLLLADSALELRATVGGGVACAVAPSTVETLDQIPGDAPPAAWWNDAPAPGDVVHLHDEGALATWRDDAWHSRDVAGVERTVSACSAGPMAAWRAAGAHYRLVLAGPPLPPTIAAGAPLRVSRRRRYVHYRDAEGSWQLGQREWSTGTGTLQPFAGPLAPATGPAPGLSIRAFDGAGAPIGAAVPDAARLAMTLRVRAGAHPGAWHDSLALLVALDGWGMP